ncbi:hemolysin family protein [Vulgatibacter incomptus]|nr:hemolysin family protein [Vulgatibacter incomptus]
MTLQAPFPALALAAIVARFFFVAAETALVAVSPERADELHAARGSLAARSLLALKRDVESSFATTRVGSISALALGAGLAGIACASWLGAESAVLSAAVGGLAAALLCVLADTVARSLAIAAPEAWALRSAPPLRLASLVVAPPARAAQAVLDRLLSPLGVRATFKGADPALEDIERILLSESHRDGPAPELVHSLFEFPSRTVRDVMVPRTEVVAAPLGIAPEALVRLVAEQGHSRLPIYDGRIDRIVGVLHTRDIVPLLAHPELIQLADAIRPPVFVPWAMRIGRLLRQMQRDRIHLAMVADEHGGFMGIVTLEDILEELVGGIRDVPSGTEVVEADGGHLVDAGIPVVAFNEHFGTALPEHGEFGTLAGFLNGLAGEIPEVGATLESHGLAFTVADRNATRVLRVLVQAAVSAKRNSA